VGWDENSLISKAKAVQTSQAKQGLCSLLPIGWQMFSHHQESRAPSHVMGTWEDKCHHSGRPPIPSCPQLYMSVTPRGLGYPLGRCGSAVPAVSPPSFLCPPSLLVGRPAREAEQSLTAHQQLRHQCVINILLILNPNHSTTPATRKKINSVPAETSPSV